MLSEFACLPTSTAVPSLLLPFASAASFCCSSRTSSKRGSTLIVVIHIDGGLTVEFDLHVNVNRLVFIWQTGDLATEVRPVSVGVTILGALEVVVG
jgi:hypothetical protein